MTAGPTIDLNADLGEGFGRWTLGDDAELLGIISSANVACGFHAGDPTIMRTVCTMAVQQQVRIGAQVGYRDLAGFGRRRIDIPRDELSADVLYQLGALDGFARAAGGRVSYLKPHGALYNTAAVDGDQAAAIVDAVLSFDPALPVLTLPGSVLASQAGTRGLPVVTEGFGDRSYRADSSLQPRAEAGAVLRDPRVIAERSVRMVRDGTVTAVDDSIVSLAIGSLCVHGDTPGAVTIARSVRGALEAAGYEIRPFANDHSAATSQRRDHVLR